MPADRRPPTATYRLQLRAGFGFDEAAALAPYLRALGVSHAYLSPILQAAPGSAHGYDVIDHRRLSDDLGGPEAYARMCAAFEAVGLGQVVDIVPNHMCISVEGNAWWWDVLENGPSSLYAHSFDVDWSSPLEIGRNKVLVPILGDHYGAVLDRGEVKAAREGARFVFRYYDHALPVAPRSLAEPLARAATRCGSDDLAFAADVLEMMPSPTATDEASLRRRHRDKAVVGRYLARLFDERPETATAVDAELAAINADPGALGAFLDRQNYRVAFWRAATHELDYRRFFDVNELAGLRADDPRVFHDTHDLILGLVADGRIDGLRVDHPDGLLDPEEYFERLRESAPSAWVVAEKILEGDETLPPSWPVDGTTGYEFLNRLMGLYVDPSAEAALTALCEELTGEDHTPFAELAVDKKRYVLKEILAADVERVTFAFETVCVEHPRYRDYALPELRSVVREALAQLPVYRTYRRRGRKMTEVDAARVDGALARVKEALPNADPPLVDFLGAALKGEVDGEAAWTFTARFQQLSGPATAKGVEDTAFFNDLRLTALNEVGGDPGRFGVSLDDFHAWNALMQEAWPATMTTTSTHDTKRSEDARLRLATISEAPEAWAEAARAMAVRARAFGNWGVSGDAVYFLAQTLVAAWPVDAERAKAFMLKASREAKKHTSWRRPDEAYEEAMLSLVERAMADAEFTTLVSRFVERVEPAARAHGLSQALVKLCSPGVPDTYQGCELWSHDLTDPDNRRPVDYAARRALLEALEGATPEAVLARTGDGLPKLWVTREALRVRGERPECFGREGATRGSRRPGRARAGDRVRARRVGGGARAAAGAVAEGGVGRHRGDAARGRVARPLHGARVVGRGAGGRGVGALPGGAARAGVTGRSPPADRRSLVVLSHGR
ncbi:MAG: malto-oligosyltrehalose synthase [Polyangiales bacterium]